MRLVLCNVAYDDTDTRIHGGLGWHVSIHDQVTSQGGEYGVVSRWGITPKTLAALGTQYDSVCWVNVPNYTLLSDCYVVPFDFTTSAELKNKITTTQCSALPVGIYNKFVAAGLDVSGTIYKALRPLLDHTQ